MSLEDDLNSVETELKDMVTQTLEENGVLSKIRAQLRAGLYIALESEINVSKHNKVDASLNCLLRKSEIKTIFCLVREFLEYFDLDFTNAVFEKESFMGTLYDYNGRQELIKDLEIGVDTFNEGPLLVEILTTARNSHKYCTKNNIEGDVNRTTFIKDIGNDTYEISSDQDKRSSNIDELQSLKKVPISELFDDKISQNKEIKLIRRSIPNKSSDASISTIDFQSNCKTEKHKNACVDTNVSNTPGIDHLKKPKEFVKVVRIEGEPQKYDTDDTYEGTSSIAEDSSLSNKEQPFVDQYKCAKTIVSGTNLQNNAVNLFIDQTLDESSPKSQKLLLCPDSNSSDKKKYDKTEKLKPMSSLSSIVDLPPLQVNKARNTDTILLPSLYSKEFRDKSNLKEIDKLLDINFDSIDNYEEDFKLGSNIDYERNKNVSSILLKNDHYKITEMCKHFLPSKLYDNENHLTNKNLDIKKNDERPVSSLTANKENNEEELITNKSNITDVSYNKDVE